jgi:hypothetical protein
MDSLESAKGKSPPSAPQGQIVTVVYPTGIQSRSCVLKNSDNGRERGAGVNRAHVTQQLHRPVRAGI